MGKPPTREIAGLVWTWKPDYETWTTETGLYVIRYDAPPGFPGGTDYFAPGPDELFGKLSDACEAEVRWAAERESAEVAHREATKASPTLEPAELDRMLGDPTPALPDPVAQEAEEREAQRRDERAYYRNLAGWAVAGLLLVALCSGVLRG